MQSSRRLRRRRAPVVYHVTEVNADPIPHRRRRQLTAVSLGHRALNVDRACYCLEYTSELAEDAITGRVLDPSRAALDHGKNHSLYVGYQGNDHGLDTALVGERQA